MQFYIAVLIWLFIVLAIILLYEEKTLQDLVPPSPATLEARLL